LLVGDAAGFELLDQYWVGSPASGSSKVSMVKVSEDFE
jgi:hypothetical protein